MLWVDECSVSVEKARLYYQNPEYILRPSYVLVEFVQGLSGVIFFLHKFVMVFVMVPDHSRNRSTENSVKFFIYIYSAIYYAVYEDSPIREVLEYE